MDMVPRWSCTKNMTYSVRRFCVVVVVVAITFILTSVTEEFPIINTETNFSYISSLKIQNITKEIDGTFVCKIYELDNPNPIELTHPIEVENAQIPFISSSSNLSNLKSATDKQLKLNCTANGLPFPTISWFKNDQLLHFAENDIRVSIIDNNRTLFIRNTSIEDEGIYVCNASNRLGSVIKTYNLTMNDKDQERFDYIIVCSVLIILLVVLTISCVTRFKNERKLKRELALAGLLHFENGAVESLNPDLGIEEQAELLPYDNRWEFPRDKLKLGSGAFGVVFNAEAIGIIDKETTTTVAVKMVKPNTDPSYIKALAAELKIMIHIGRHLNVVNLLGAYTGNINKRELIVIVEYCRFGNIHQYLLKQRNCFVDQVTPDGFLDYSIKIVSKNPYYQNVSNNTNSSTKHNNSGIQIGSDGYLVSDEFEPEWRSNYGGDYGNLILKPSCTHDLICWSFQVARGMEYLANRKILYGDLATRNILLAEDNVVKICDFGFAKTMYNSKNYKKTSDKVLLPVKWMAIESLRDRVFSTQSDVWAFGIVLWEIFSLAVTPYPNFQNFNELFIKLVEGYRMEQPKYANSDLYNIMLDCWKMSPMERPSFSDLAERLSDLLQDGIKSHYMNLNDVFMRMNTKSSQSTDYLSILTAPTYLNCSTMPENNSNTYQNILEHSEKLMLHNPVEFSGNINQTKPSSISNPNYDVVDKSKKYS